jgi:protein required for attachment to host cells
VKHWVVVTDTGSCRVFETDEGMEGWTPVQGLVHEGIHKGAADLVSGPRGATQSAPGGRAAFERHADPHEVEQLKFARAVAEHMGAAFVQGDWERAVLVAPPKFLGQVRAALPERALHQVVASIHHDFTRLPDHELPDAVRKHMPETAGLELER